MKSLAKILSESKRHPRLEELIKCASAFLEDSELIDQRIGLGSSISSFYIGDLYEFRRRRHGYFKNVQGVEESISVLLENDVPVKLAVAETDHGPLVCWIDDGLNVKGVLVPDHKG